MKKFLCAGLLLLSLFVTGCEKKKSGRIENLTVEQMKTKMDKKESFAIVFTQPECGYCKGFKEMLQSYLPDHNLVLYDVSLDRGKTSSEEFDKLLEEINTYFPEMSSTPDLYYVKDGAIEERIDANEVDIKDEDVFHEWVVKHKLLEE